MEIRFKCSNCGKENIIEVEDEIDITNKKDLLKSILDNTYFEHECKSCNTKNLVLYPILIKNSFNKYYVKINTNNENLYLLNNEEGYKIRIVKDLNEANEKIRIFNYLLEDYYVESIKYLLKRDLENSNENLVVDSIYFYKVENGFLHFLIFDKERYLGDMKYSLSGYFEIEERLKDKINKLEQIIDEKYIVTNNIY